MIVALFALAAFMIVGGGVAVVQGFPFVRLESGQAMVNAGAGIAAAGTVLIGLGIVAVHLRRIERALASGNGAGMPRATPAPGAPAPVAEAAMPAGAALAALSAPPQSHPVPPQETARIEPVFEAAPVPAEPPAREPELPIPGLQPAPPQPPAEAAVVEPEPEPEPSPAQEAAAADLFDAAPEVPPLRPALDPVPEAPAAAPKKVVGRHVSGGNTYVMYADGSIDAETPAGRRSFASLEELRAFIDAGGEGGARGAA